MPKEAIEGSVKAIVKIYPSSFSQLVEGLDGIFQRPYGCFEQTSSTTYPNVLALDYLRRTGKSVPAVEAKARQYIQLGYQRLLGRQRADGSWSPDGRMLHGDPTRSDADVRLTTTAYVAWSVFGHRPHTPGSQAALDWLTAHRPASIGDPYALALVANAVGAIADNPSAERPYLERLETMKRTSPDGKLAWWEQAPGGRTTFYGAGMSGSVETTALGALAMVRSGHSPATARAALAWLAEQKDAQGTWHSTQATVLALKALLAGTGKPLGGDRERRIEIALDGKPARAVTIPPDQGDVVAQVDLSSLLTQGTHRLSLVDGTDTAAGYQVAFRYHVPGGAATSQEGPLAVDLAYDKTELATNDLVGVTATVTNRQPTVAPMVILDLPIPAGFAVEPDDFSRRVADGTIAKYQVTPRSVIVYLRRLALQQPLRLRYRLRATMPVKVTAPAARAYEYYNPDKEAVSPAVRLTVTARG